MRTLSLLTLLLLVLLAPARAQDVSIARLMALTTPPVNKTEFLPEWILAPFTPQATEEPLTWGWWIPEEERVGPPLLQLSLRPSANGYDVLLYSQQLALYNQLRRELERQHLTAVPVTCLGGKCLGFRFTTATCTVAFYEGKAGDYPFMVVVQPLAVAARPAGSTSPAKQITNR